MLQITNLLYLQLFRQTSMTSDSKTLEVSVILFSKIRIYNIYIYIYIYITNVYHKQIKEGKKDIYMYVCTNIIDLKKTSLS